MAKVKDPREFFALKLSKVHAAEEGIFELLRTGAREASDRELAGLFQHHAKETEEQLRNLEKAFEQLGEQPQDVKNRIVEALENEYKEFKRSNPPQELIDAFLVGGAEHTEHHEISSYESLITIAQALGEPEIVSLLKANLAQEQQTLKEVQRAAKRLAKELKQTAPARA